MGLFKKKELCSLCEKENAKIQFFNGFICNKCYGKTSPFLSNTVDISQRRKREILEAFEKYDINQMDKSRFKTTRTISTFIEIDEENKLFRMLDNFGKVVEDGIVYNYGDITNFELVENALSINRGGKGLPKTAKINGQNQKAFVDTLFFRYNSSNKNKTGGEIKIVGSELNIRSKLYNSIYGNILELFQFMESTLDEGTDSVELQMDSEIDTVEELIKVKSLLEEGIITEEEYEKIENRLLGF